MNTTFNVKAQTHGPDEDMQMLRERTMENFKPRLSRPMEFNSHRVAGAFGLGARKRWHLCQDIHAGSLDAMRLYATVRTTNVILSTRTS